MKKNFKYVGYLTPADVVKYSSSIATTYYYCLFHNNGNWTAAVHVNA